MDGVASYRKLRELQSGTAAIIVTAYAGSATLSDAVICTLGRCQQR
jgi:hypothetical protein